MKRLLIGFTALSYTLLWVALFIIFVMPTTSLPIIVFFIIGYPFAIIAALVAFGVFAQKFD